MATSKCVAIFLAIFISVANAVPYSKYGRTCKDIGCRSDEVCVMAEDPCNSYQRDSCGRYPTCQRSSSGGESCTTKFCPSGTYCKTENGKPTCVNTNPNLAPAARRPPGYVRPQVTQRPTAPPTPPPRNSSFDNRYFGRGGSSGNRVPTGGGAGNRGSIWDSVFGGGGSRTRPGSSGFSDYYRTTTSRSTYNYEEDGTVKKESENNDQRSSYPSESNMDIANTNSKPQAPQPSGYPSESDHANNPIAAYPAGSGYPASSGYPSGSGYPGSTSNSNYPSGSGYPGYSNQDSSSRRTSQVMNNAGNAGQPMYPGPNPYNNPYGNNPYPPPPQGGYNPYQGGYNPYQGGYNPNYPPPQGQFPNQGFDPNYGQQTTTKKPSLSQQLTSFAKNIAQNVFRQAIIDKISGKS